MRFQSQLLLLATLAVLAQCSHASDRHCRQIEVPYGFVPQQARTGPEGSVLCVYRFNELVEILLEVDTAGSASGIESAMIEGVEVAADPEALDEVAESTYIRLRSELPGKLPAFEGWTRFPPVAALVTVTARAVRVTDGSFGLAVVVPVSALGDFARSVRKSYPDRPFELSADKELPAGKVVEVLEALATAGIEQINVRTVPPTGADRGRNGETGSYLQTVGGVEIALDADTLSLLAKRSREGAATFGELLSALR